MKILFVTVFFLLLIPAAFADTPLPVAHATFVIPSICIGNVTGPGFLPIGPLFIFGTKDYLNVIWNADYNGCNGLNIGNISVACYLNCPLSITDISQCVSPSIQSCSYSGSTGVASCLMNQPKYNYKIQNTVICSFQDPDIPSVTYKPYPNGTFLPVSFSFQLPTSITFPIGKFIQYPVTIYNLGLLPDTYSVNTTSNYPSAFSILTNPVTTPQSLYGQKVSAYPNLQFALSRPYTLTFLVSSAADSTICAVDTDCSTLVYGAGAICINHICNYKLQLPVSATTASLPDFDWTGLVQILVLSIIVFAVMSRKIKVLK